MIVVVVVVARREESSVKWRVTTWKPVTLEKKKNHLLPLVRKNILTLEVILEVWSRVVGKLQQDLQKSITELKVSTSVPPGETTRGKTGRKVRMFVVLGEREEEIEHCSPLGKTR